MRLRASTAVLCIAVILLAAAMISVAMVACTAFVFPADATAVVLHAPEAEADPQPVPLRGASLLRAPPASPLA